MEVGEAVDSASRLVELSSCNLLPPLHLLLCVFTCFGPFLYVADALFKIVLKLIFPPLLLAAPTSASTCFCQADLILLFPPITIII